MIFLNASNSSAQSKPNIIFILADDLGYTDLSCYGNPFNKTPNIDALANNGLKFLQAYSCSPVCSPSRAGILTSKHPARLKLTNFLVGNRTDSASPVLPANWIPRLSPQEVTIAEMLRGQNYKCGMVGKWHLGYQDSLIPYAQGFDYERVISKNGLDYYNYSIAERNKTIFEDHGSEYLTDKLTQYAVEFIDQNQKNPFFLYLSYSAPHVLIIPRGDKLRNYLFRYSDFNGKYNPYYAAMLESLDEGVGRIVQKVKELGIEKNTLIIFTSDNGGVGLPELGPTPTNLEPLRDWKGFVYEGGVRIPLLISWLGTIDTEKVVEQYTTNLDFFPTFMDLLHLRKPGNLDGNSIYTQIFEDHQYIDDRTLFWHYPHFSNQGGRPAGAMRQGNYKLVHQYEFDKFELFDLQNDISEERDIQKKQPDIFNKMLHEWKEWLRDVDANMPLKNPSGPS